MRGSAIIGRVIPVPQGEWIESKTYKKLDIVYSEGISYIAKKDIPATTPLNNTEYWQIIAVGTTGPTGSIGETGPAAGFGIPVVSITTLQPNEDAYISITSSGENTQKVFQFDFGIPQGTQGIIGPTGATGPQGVTGPTGSVYLPVFDVDFTDGVLYAYQYEEGPHFEIDSNGDLYMDLRSE